MPLLDFIGAIESAFGKTATKRLLPMPDSDVQATWAETSLLKDWIDFSHRASPIEEGVSRFVTWYRD